MTSFNIKALFLYNEADLHAPIPGGVQMCSKEFLDIIRKMADKLVMFSVTANRSFSSRILHRLNINNYTGYRPRQYSKQLKLLIINHGITHIFINKSELLRFTKVIRQMEIKPAPKLILMSHGNESGDLLGDLSAEQPTYSGLLRWTGILKLGMTLYTESFYRRRYVDLVCTMSEEENALERWLGINNPFFIPRIIEQDAPHTGTRLAGRFGYVGTLNHQPNIMALEALCKVIAGRQITLNIRIAGRPAQLGQALAQKYSFIEYLGALSDAELNLEMQSWSFFINPIFNYSRGASMKLATAISSETPVITTRAGRRGYSWSEGSLIETEDTPQAFAEAMEHCMTHYEHYPETLSALRNLKSHSPDTAVIARQLRQFLISKNTQL